MIVSTDYIELGDIVECLDNQRIPVNDEERCKRKGDVPYYGANGQVGFIDDFLFNEELLLLAEDGGSWGLNEKCAYIIKGKSWVNNHAHVLRCKEEVDILFLMHFLNYFNLRSYISGTTRGKLNQQRMNQIKIPSLNIEGQRRISSTLGRVESTLEKRRETLRLADEFLKSAFLEMFGEPVSNVKKWPIKDFKFSFSSIKYGTGSPPVYQDSGIPFIRATNIKQGTVLSKDMKFISVEEARKIEKCKLSTGDLILVRSGVNAGDCGLIPQHYDGAYAAYDLIIKLPYPSAVFFNHLINSDFGKTMLAPLKRRAGQPHLNAEQISSLIFITPPIEEQQKFADLVQKVEKYKAKLKQSEQHLQNLFNSLMQKAFRGDVFQE